ncbi:hypothetical protein [Endozoicomonas euniceicola]|uniref:DUF4367 domain-containing protein n=1 Tax=Endozoicomonas euniceicola TaxID=1234143 RepID=A0ABY6GTW9_9GAMM|nr:hypothetical protein [Endozoicomonas euniceicola]UYM16212.1 hypothetical protein NX720_26020 [Endozoicomonas euniceicola]
MKLRNLILILIAVVLTGCASPGPMQLATGPMNTPVFDPVILNTVNDGSETVRFKEWTTMYENKELRLWGVFFITDKGAYLASWDSRGYEYNLRYQMKANDIKSFEDDTVVRDWWADSNLLVITDKNNIKVGFALNGKNAARSILNDIRKM